MNVELRSTSKPLSQKFCTLFNREVLTESAKEQVASVMSEEVCSAVATLDVNSWSPHQRLSNALVAGSESITKV